MDNIRGSEWLVFMAMLIHLIMAPFTKVEESFNTQAIHDILHLRHNISQVLHALFLNQFLMRFAVRQSSISGRRAANICWPALRERARITNFRCYAHF